MSNNDVFSQLYKWIRNYIIYKYTPDQNLNMSLIKSESSSHKPKIKPK